ncbi:LysM peptidoglycan-binding domain-containing protein [Chondrinema litorale]|uniref:LysM peptidoglycan-binding domain-containing protein n=1 Tax=Chondrinema litorale TaxID=2994555 RepID=UPI0025433094|nr:LysM peptidoglycan-binding domain-containing protein [Chondrinema litorale]UZR92575.1 LysM peptidoglycan-binding domain-containing protein [Chondrinema litorale]
MIHVVQPGETLYSIGKKYNLSTTELLDLNNMNAYDTLSIGQSLIVSEGTTSSASTSSLNPGLGQYYAVRRGDSLYSIAKKYNTTPQQLLLLNGLNANQSIYIGQQLKVKADSKLSGSTTTTVPTVSSITGNIQYYTVKTGDSLYAIAQKFDTSADAIQQQNGLSASTSIYPGQRLVIPSGGTQTTTTQTEQSDYYTVQKGDTLYAIAQKYNTTPQYILQLNNLSTQSRLYIGQELKIRETTTTKVTEAAPTVNTQTELSSDVYTVQRGDSLYAIAQKYGTTPQKILELNDLAANATIYVGQMLRVKAPSSQAPANNSNFQSYTVQSGDWLAKIADRFGITPEEIVRLNNISGGALYVGQQLLIPAKKTTSVPSYQSSKATSIEKARSIFQLQEVNGIDIFGTGLQSSVGKVYNNLPADLEKVQNRLIQLGLLTPNHGESPNVLKSRLGSSPIGQGSIPKTVSALVSFQSKYNVSYWTKNDKHVQMLGTSSYTSGVVAPNDVTYKVLREYTDYTLVVPHPTLQGQYITSQFNNFVRSSYNEYYNGIGFRGNSMPDIPVSVFESLGLDENMALGLKYVSHHEGNFDAINTYDKANFSWGFIQFAGKGGNTNGSLSAVIATMKNNQPQLFAEFFEKVGIDVDIITRNGEIHDGNLKVYDLHAVTGKHETEGLDAEIALKSDKQLYGAFIRAAYHPQLYTAQLERAVIGYVRPALSITTDISTGGLNLSGIALNRIISSPMGSALMVDLTVNQWINKTREVFKSAIEKVAARRGVNTASGLQQLDEREVLQQIIADAGSDVRIKTRTTSILNSTLSPQKPGFVAPLV